MKDLNKAIRTGRQLRKDNKLMDLKVEDVLELCSRYHGDPDSLMDVIIEAYSAGLAVGAKQGNTSLHIVQV